MWKKIFLFSIILILIFIDCLGNQDNGTIINEAFLNEKGQFWVDFRKEIFEKGMSVVLYNFSYNVETFELLSPEVVVRNYHYKIELENCFLKEKVDILQKLNGITLTENKSDELLNTRLVAEFSDSSSKFLEVAIGFGNIMYINNRKFIMEYTFSKIMKSFLPKVVID